MDMSNNAKTVKVVKLGLLIVAGYIVYRLATNFYKNQGSREEEDAGTTELEELNKNSETRQKISNQQAQSYANVLFTAMNGYGTDEEAIVSVFYKLRNNADYLALSNAYGSNRVVSSGRGNVFEPDFRGTMASALRSELSSYWTKRINKILTNKKITYKI